MQESIRYERIGHVGIITLDRPQALNALRRDMVAQLEQILADIESAGDLRVLVLTGEGRAFSAGVDLLEAEQDLSGKDTAEVEGGLTTIQNLTRILLRLPIPTIAAVNGLAVGMGSEICIACDIRLAAPDAYLWFSEARRGLFQSNGVMYLLPRLIGHSRSIEWMMSCRKIHSDELLQSGLVAKIIAAEDFRAAAIDYAQQVAGNSPLSLRLLKRVGQQSFEAGYDDVLQLEVDGMEETMKSDYAREGLRAFAEKREPNF